MLEIGCSTGYLMHKLVKMGAVVVGCEPGLQAVAGRVKYDLDIIQEMFRPELFSESFDCIYSRNVLEHVVDPETFINDIKKVLKPGGLAFFGVPDCQKDIKVGYPGMLLHEHWNYFTSKSMITLIQSCGYTQIGSKHASYGSNMYVWGRLVAQEKNELSASKSRKVQQDFRKEALLYANKLALNIKKCQDRIEKAESGGKTIGLYGASNTMNFLGLLDWPNQPRIFDTDHNKHGLYVSCGVNAIESPNNLVENPVDQLWILPLNFYEEIRKYLNDSINIPESTEILGFDEIVSN